MLSNYNSIDGSSSAHNAITSAVHSAQSGAPYTVTRGQFYEALFDEDRDTHHRMDRRRRDRRYAVAQHRATHG